MHALKIFLLTFSLGYFISNGFCKTLADNAYAPELPGVTGSGGATGGAGRCPAITINLLRNLPDTCISKNGSLAVSATGGQTPYTYHWSNSVNDSSVSNLGTGNYLVTVTDKNGCTATTTATVTSVTESIKPTYSNTSPICTAHNGAIVMDPTGGKTPYKYAWSNGSTASSLTDLAAGSYTVTVTSANGCPVVKNITLTASETSMTLSTSARPDTCGMGKGAATATVTSAASKSPFKYIWSGNGGLSATVTGLTAANYEVTVIDVDGCSAAASAKVGSIDNNCASSLPSPVANYHLDACTGNTVFDSTGKFNGTVTDPSWAVGYINQGLEFSGNGQSEVTLPMILTVPELTSGFTCSAWIKANGGNSNRLILSAYSVGMPDVLWLFIGADGTLQYTFNVGMATASFNTNYVVPVDAWTHIAVVYNRVNMIVYANGVAVYSIPVSLREPVPLGFRIGGSSNTGLYFSGTIDEVKVFTQVLDSSQIRILAGAKESAKPCAESVREEILSGIENEQTPETAGLSSSPNPFVTQVNFRLTLPNEARVQLMVYDLSGKMVANLSNEVMPAGTHQISWNGKTQNGTPVTSGVYVAHAIIGDKVFNHRIIYEHIGK